MFTVFLKRRSLLALCCAMTACFAVNQTVRGGTFGTVGVYDSTSNANIVDVDTGGLSEFTLRVADAFSQDAGGVVDFQAGFTAGTPTVVPSTFSFDYGTSVSKTLSVTSTDNIDIWNNNIVGQVIAISDTNTFITDTDDDFSLTFGAITGGLPGEAVREVGFTILSRNVSGFDLEAIVNVTANFSGGGSSSILNQSISDELGAEDTFFRFVAPGGEWITSLDFINSSTNAAAAQRRLPIDDFGFVTTAYVGPVPEPSTALLLGIGLLGLAKRRRRKID